MKKMNEYHHPVLFQECLEGLQIKANGVYVDATFGSGGHSQGILNRLTTGSLIAFDQDQDAMKNARGLYKTSAKAKSSFTFIESNFRYLKKCLRLHHIVQVDGILADLGVSSHQLDEPKRGFAIHIETELDMRMDQTAEKKAKEVINKYEEASLIHVLRAYGEVKNAQSLVRDIVMERTKEEIRTSKQLREIALRHVPKGRKMKYLAQVFQSIRIEVNDEIEALKELLTQAGDILKKEGRLAILSYHSLEDRLVKNFVSKGNLMGMDEKDFYGNPIRIFDPVNRKPIVPTVTEIKRNRRARSAKLRIGIKR